MAIIDRIKYGRPIENIDLGSFNVAGPVDRTKTAIGARYNLSGLVNPDFIREDGQIFDSEFASRGDYIEFMRGIGQAYFDGRLNSHGSVIPINSEYFVLPIDLDILTNLIHKVNGLQEVSFSGKVKHPLDKGMLIDYISAMTDARFSLTEEEFNKKWGRTQVKQTPLKQAQQYLKDLLFWRLDFFDYSDGVTINVQERKQVEKTSGFCHGLRKNFIVNREWSKANKDSSGVWRVIEKDGERVVISGYQPGYQ